MKRLGDPIDGASLGVFRIAVGLLLVVELVNDVAHGDFAEYVADTIHFSYPFFEWLRPWPPAGMAAHWWLTILLALLLSVGLATRVAAIFLFFAWTAIFLMERAEYVNHTYLYCWITFWLAVLPIGRVFSVDAWLRRREPVSPFVPAWVRLVFLFQISVVYSFAGIAKIDGDWLAGAPLRIWLPMPDTLRVLRPIVATDVAALAIAWGGLAFDLGIVPLLVWRRTRTFAFVLAIAFHATNAAIFGLSSFPWFSIAATSLFLDPSWPRRLFRRPPLPAPPPPFPLSRLAVAALAAVAVLHLAVPLRHWLYPGDVRWTEEGHPFSWRMMLRTKSGKIRFLVHDPDTGTTEYVRPESILTRHQARLVPGQPDMILQVAHALAADRRSHGIARPQVFAEGSVSLNGRPFAPLVDPSVDLAAERWTFRPWTWLSREPPDHRARGD